MRRCGVSRDTCGASPLAMLSTLEPTGPGLRGVAAGPVKAPPGDAAVVLVAAVLVVVEDEDDDGSGGGARI